MSALAGLEPSAHSIPANARTSSKSATWLRRVFSFPVLLAVLLALLTFLTCRNRFQDPDMWWHLRIGEFIWHSHSLPDHDVYSYTTNGHSWIPHEWLAEVIIYS